MHLPEQANCYVQVHGVSLGELGQSQNLGGMNITVRAGMAKGLPMANYKQAGILAQGQIQRAYGNWEGMNSSITFILYTGASSPSSNQTTANPNTASSIAVPSTNTKPANIVFRWTKGQPLMQAIVQALQIPFPMYNIEGSISQNLVWSSGQDAVQIFSQLQTFAQWVHERSLHMLGGYAPDKTLYMGVQIAFQNNTITIYDGSTPTTPKQLQFNDLIGQPTRVENFAVNAVVVMRGDIQVGDYVAMPPAVGVTTQGAPSNAFLPDPSKYTAGAQFYSPSPSASPKDSSNFEGTYLVSAVRHVGASRDPSGLSWITVLTLQNLFLPLAAPVPALPVVYTGASATGYFLP
jgi:hypothetical protein